MQLLVVCSDPMADVPADTRVRLLKALEDVAATLSEIPVSSLVWDSLEAAPMQLDFEGWRFIYGEQGKRPHSGARTQAQGHHADEREEAFLSLRNDRRRDRPSRGERPKRRLRSVANVTEYRFQAKSQQ